MISFAQLVDFARGLDGEGNDDRGRLRYAMLARGAVMSFWNARTWPFHFSESSIVTVPPFTAGTVTLTSDSPNVTHSGAGFLTTWPSPVLLIPSDVQDVYLMTVTGPSTGTLDRNFVGATGPRTFRAEFPYYGVPADFLSMNDPNFADWRGPAVYSDLEQFLFFRDSSWACGSPRLWAIKDGDGLLPKKLCVYPSPEDAEVVRFMYRRQAPRCSYYYRGLAAVAAGGTAVTGTGGTAWQKMGFSGVGMVLEFPGILHNHDVKTLISAVGSDVAMTCGAWGGEAMLDKSYVLSDQLKFPDDALDVLQTIMQIEICKLRKEPTMLPALLQMKREQMNIFAGAHCRTESILSNSSLYNGQDSEGCGDGEGEAFLPRSVIVN